MWNISAHLTKFENKNWLSLLQIPKETEFYIKETRKFIFPSGKVLILFVTSDLIFF